MSTRKRLWMILAAAVVSAAWLAAPARAGEGDLAVAAPSATSAPSTEPNNDASSAQGDIERYYYAVLMDGQKIGHVVHARKVVAGTVHTMEAMSLTVLRGGMALRVDQTDKSIETLAGEPLSFESVQNLGGTIQTVRGTIAGGKMTVTQPNQEQPVAKDFPRGALMAEGTRLLEASKGLAEGTEYSYQAFMPSMLNAMAAHVKVGPPRRIDLLGRVVTLPEAVTTVASPAGELVITSYVDEHLVPQKTIMPLMGMTMEIIACDKAAAMSEGTLVDFLAKTMLESPSPIPSPQTAASATYVLEPTGQGKLDRFIVTDCQSVQPGANGELIVTVAPAKAPSGVKFPYTGTDPAALDALKPNRYLESDNPKVIALARQAVGDATDAAVAVRRIQDFVKGYIVNKDMSVGYASAAEVAESKEGDCTEHAVLTAAMCRAVGIPARVVAGYVYVPEYAGRRNVFGGHAWAEAYLGGKWVGLDATRGYVGVGHIAQAVGDGEPANFFGAINTMGCFRITKVTVKE